MRFHARYLLWLLLALGYARTGAAETLQEAAARHIAQLEKQLAAQEKLHRKGFTSAAKLDDVRGDLAKAKHDLAGINRDDAEASKQRRVLFEVRKRELERIRKLQKRGHEFTLPSTRARRRIAVHRFLEAEENEDHQALKETLSQVIELCERESQLWRDALAKQTATRFDVSRATNRLVCAQYLQAKVNAQAADAIRALQQTVDRLKSDWKTVVRLRQSGGATIFEELYTQSVLRNAEIRLATAEENGNDVREQLNRLLADNAKMLAIAEKPDSGIYAAKNPKDALKTGLAFELKRDQARLAAAMANRKFIDDLSIAALDP